MMVLVSLCGQTSSMRYKQVWVTFDNIGYASQRYPMCAVIAYNVPCFMTMKEFKDVFKEPFTYHEQAALETIVSFKGTVISGPDDDPCLVWGKIAASSHKSPLLIKLSKKESVSEESRRKQLFRRQLLRSYSLKK